MFLPASFWGPGMRDLEHYLERLRRRQGSDLFFSAGAPVLIKVEGRMEPLEEEPLSADEVEFLATSIMSEEQREGFRQRPELNLALSDGGSKGRFRVNVYRQRGSTSMAVRYLQGKIPSLEELNLPDILRDLVMAERGMVLVVGGTGTGKSTALASMIDYRNRTVPGHILTVEDPIEFIHHYKKSLVEQREVGIDTLSYGDALKNAMREAPDVIMIGEVRDQKTMQHAIAYAETGHLCLATLHANNANQALERIATFFPEVQQSQLFMDLSLNLRAIVSLRLVPGVDGKRVPAVEVMLNSPHLADLVKKGEIDTIREAMERDESSGSQTFDQALYQLFKAGRITRENALRYAESATNLRLQIHLEEGPPDGDLSGLSFDKR